MSKPYWTTLPLRKVVRYDRERRLPWAGYPLSHVEELECGHYLDNQRRRAKYRRCWQCGPQKEAEPT